MTRSRWLGIFIFSLLTISTLSVQAQQPTDLKEPPEDVLFWHPHKWRPFYYNYYYPGAPDYYYEAYYFDRYNWPDEPYQFGFRVR